MKRPSSLSKILDILSATPATARAIKERISGRKQAPELFFVVPNSGWAVDRVGDYVTSEIRRQFGWSTHLITRPHLLSGHILHYGELGAFLNNLGRSQNRRNKIAVTVFHGDRDSRFPDVARASQRFIENEALTARIHVTCQLMENRIRSWGISAEKLIRIPLGIDLALFKPTNPDQRIALRRGFGIPEDHICIGSFQKDGIGWDEGAQPKLIKGPDMFLRVVEELSRRYPIFVLLSGPARGYVKSGLKSAGIPYCHRLLTDLSEMPLLYQCLDLYLITSREEGGPNALLEAMATGVPIVSTRVGMAPDLIRHRLNGMLVEIDNFEELSECASEVIEDNSLKNTIINQALAGITSYDWPRIAARYYHELYLPLLETT